MVVKLISNMGVSSVKSIVDMKHGIGGKIHVINSDVPRTRRSKNNGASNIVASSYLPLLPGKQLDAERIMNRLSFESKFAVDL
jgi:hypothetical protein